MVPAVFSFKFFDAVDVDAKLGSALKCATSLAAAAVPARVDVPVPVIVAARSLLLPRRGTELSSSMHDRDLCVLSTFESLFRARLRIRCCGPHCRAPGERLRCSAA